MLGGLWGLRDKCVGYENLGKSSAKTSCLANTSCAATYLWRVGAAVLGLSICPALLRKLVHRLRDGSGSSIGMPVADVVVDQVAVDIRRIKLGGRLRLPRCNNRHVTVITMCYA